MIGAVVVLVGRSVPVIKVTVAAVTVVLALSSVGLLLVLASRSFAPLAIEAQALYPLSPVLIVADLALTALFIIIGWRLRSMIIAAAAALNLALTVLLGAWTGFSESDPAMLIDNLALIMALITSLVGSVIAIYSFRYMREDPRQPRFFAVTLLFLGGMNAAVFSNDLLWLFLFWDVTTLCSFLLIAHDGTMEPGMRRGERWPSPWAGPRRSSSERCSLWSSTGHCPSLISRWRDWAAWPSSPCPCWR